MRICCLLLAASGFETREGRLSVSGYRRGTSRAIDLRTHRSPPARLGWHFGARPALFLVSGVGDRHPERLHIPNQWTPRPTRARTGRARARAGARGGTKGLKSRCKQSVDCFSPKQLRPRVQPMQQEADERALVFVVHAVRFIDIFSAPQGATFPRHCTPVSVSRGGCSFQFGRASAPTMPQPVHTIRGPNIGTAA